MHLVDVNEDLNEMMHTMLTLEKMLNKYMFWRHHLLTRELVKISSICLCSELFMSYKELPKLNSPGYVLTDKRF